LECFFLGWSDKRRCLGKFQAIKWFRKLLIGNARLCREKFSSELPI
jgi:hypothetical protein